MALPAHYPDKKDANIHARDAAGQKGERNDLGISKEISGPGIHKGSDRGRIQAFRGML